MCPVTNAEMYTQVHKTQKIQVVFSSDENWPNNQLKQKLFQTIFKRA